jgi:hypothetical protein
MEGALLERVETRSKTSSFVPVNDGVNIFEFDGRVLPAL